MCGIAGYRSPETHAPTLLGDMLELLVHRGPDAAGVFGDPPLTMGMRRLSINDIAGGDQPLFNADRTVAIVYNGEIYNYPELRRDLEARGCRFRSRSDGEVICHLYDLYGLDLFERLDGMFAVALWSVPERRLVLARDLPGEKPLYYAEPRPGTLAFASEIPALARFPDIDLEIDAQALWDYPTFLWVPEPATIHRGIRALPRGHLLIADDDGVRLRPFANRFNLDPLPDDDDAVVEETRRVVTAAIRSRLLSDVPVGAFLSSGLDSSIVATVAAGALPHLTTFSIGFENAHDPYHGQADESAAAAEYARRLGTTHHTLHVTAADFRAELEHFCRHAGEPFAVSSGLGILTVARAAREQGIKVLLSGDGADELFGGYSWYAHLDTLPPPAPAPMAPVSYQNFGMPLKERLSVLAGHPPALRAWAWHYYSAEAEKTALFAPEIAAESSLRHFTGGRNGAGPETPLDVIRHDRGFYLPFEMLRKVDRMTMAHSVEGRVPFVAPSVLAHAEKLRFRHLVRGDTLKWALRTAFAGLLPPEVATRPKHGFNVPIDHWLKGCWPDLMERSFAPGSALDRAGLLSRDAWTIARAMLHDPVRLNGHTLLCYIMLNIWLEERQAPHGNHR